MGFFGENPIAEGAAIRDAILSIVEAQRKRELQKQLRIGLEAAKQLFFDENFAPRNMSDIYNATDEQKQAIRTLMELDPQVQSAVMQFVKSFREQFGPPPVRKEIAEQMQNIAGGLSKGGQVDLGSLLGAVSQMQPHESSTYSPFMNFLYELARKQLEPHYETLPPGSKLVDVRGDEVKERAYNPPLPSSTAHELKPMIVSPGAAVFDPNTGRAVFYNPNKQENPLGPVTEILRKTSEHDPTFTPQHQKDAMEYAMKYIEAAPNAPPEYVAYLAKNAAVDLYSILSEVPEYKVMGGVLRRDPKAVAEKIAPKLAEHIREHGVPITTSKIAAILKERGYPDAIIADMVREVVENINKYYNAHGKKNK